MSGVDLGSAYGTLSLKTDDLIAAARAAAMALRQFDTDTKGVGKNLDQIGKDGANAGKQIAGGAEEAATHVKNLSAVAKTASDEFSKMGTAATLAGAAIIAGLGGAIKEASDLEQAVAKVSTIAPEIDTKKVTRDLSQMSTQIAQSSTQLAESLNNIFSSIDTNQEDALKLTADFGKGAVAAATDAQTFGNAVLGVMNAYGLSVDQATHISDVFFNTIKIGVISGDQLARGLGQVTQAAKLAGVDFDTLGALIAGVTREGGDASVNMTNLQNALSKLNTAATQTALNDFGVQTRTATGEARNFIDILIDLNNQLNKLSPAARADALRKIFPDIQAVAGISTLLNQLPAITNALKQNKDAAGAAEDAYKKMSSTAASQAQILKNTFMATLGELGTAALPDMIAVTQKLRDILVSFNDMDEGTRSTIMHVAELTAGLLLLVGAASKVIGAISGIVTALKAIATFATAIGVTIEGIVTAAAGLGAPLAVLFGNTTNDADKANDAILKVADTIKGPLHDAIEGIQISKWQAFLDILTGTAIDTQIDKAVQKWIDGTDGISRSTKEIQQQYDALSAEFMKNPTGIGMTPEQVKIRDRILFDLQKELVDRGELNKLVQQYIDLNKDAAAAQPPPPQMFPWQQGEAEEQLRVIEAEKQRQQMEAGLTGTSSSLAMATEHVNTAAKDATPVIDAQAEATRKLAELQDQLQGSIDRTASAIAPLNDAMAILAAKQAAGIPLTQREAEIWAQYPGLVGGAASATDDLSIAAAQVAINQINAAGSTNAFGSAAGNAADPVNILRGQVELLNIALNASQKAQSDWEALIGVIQPRIDVLQKLKDAGTITPDQQAELDSLVASREKAAYWAGIEAANSRATAQAEIDKRVALEQATKLRASLQNVGTTAGQSAAAALGADDNVAWLAGIVSQTKGPISFTITPTIDPTGRLNVDNFFRDIDIPHNVVIKPVFDQGGLGAGIGKGGIAVGEVLAGGSSAFNISVALTDNATGPINQVLKLVQDYQQLNPTTKIGADGSQAIGVIGTVTGDINKIPDSHNTDITATDNATTTINNILGALNQLPTSFSVTANVDISGALAAINTLRANMPSSPAKEGPFHELPDWHSIYDTLEPAGQEAVNTVHDTVTKMGEGIVEGINNINVESAKNAAEFANSIASAVVATVNATEALARLRTPNAGKITQLRDAIQAIMSAFADLQGGPTTEEATKAAQDWQDNAGRILSLVGTGVDSLSKLATFERPTDQAVLSFRDVAQFVVNVMAQVAHDTSLSAVVAAGVWSDGAGKIFAALGSGVDALSKLDSFERPTDQAVNSFRDVAQYVVNVFAQVAADSELGPVADAGTWADSAIKIVTLIGTGVDSLSKLEDWERPSDQAVASFRDVAQFFVNMIAQVAADTDKKAVADAATYADNASKIVGLVGAGVTAFKSLTEGEFTPPSPDQLQQLAKATRDAVIAIEEASRDLETKGVSAAGKYADDATKVVSLIGAGLQGFKDWSSFVPPSAQQIQQLKSVISATVIAIAQAASELSPEATKAAGEYANGAGKAISVVGTTISAFGNMKDWVAPSKEAIQQVASVAGAAVEALVAIAGTYSKAQLSQLENWGNAASAGFGAIRGALDAGKALGEDHIAPADALNKVLGEFQAGLSPLAQLAAVSETYKSQGLQIGANIAQSYSSIMGSIPGFSPQSATVTAMLAPGAQIVQHQFSGGINISFLGENGTWVVKSLQVDTTSRSQIADMIATEIANDLLATGVPLGA